VRTYIPIGKYTKDAKEPFKTKVALKRHRLRIETITDRTSISDMYGYGTRKKAVDEWGLAPDRQTLTLETRYEDQSVQVAFCGGVADCALSDENNRRMGKSERVYKRRVLLTEALSEAAGNN